MKIAIVKNKYLNAVFLLMLFSAAVHMVILFCVALWKQDPDILNYFNIITLFYIFGDRFHGMFWGIISVASVFCIYWAILFFNNEQ